MSLSQFNGYCYQIFDWFEEVSLGYTVSRQFQDRNVGLELKLFDFGLGNNSYSSILIFRSGRLAHDFGWKNEKGKQELRYLMSPKCDPIWYRDEPVGLYGSADFFYLLDLHKS